VSVIDKLNANTQAIIAGKTAITTAIINKGGSVDQAGALPTFSELVDAVKNIQTYSPSYAPEAVINVKLIRSGENQLKIVWENPTDLTNAWLNQVRIGLNYIPTIPEAPTDYIVTVGWATTEVVVDIDLSSLVIGDFVGVWVTPVSVDGAVQSIKNDSNTATVTIDEYAVTEVVNFKAGSSVMAVNFGEFFFDFAKITTSNSNTTLTQDYLDKAIYYLHTDGSFRCCIPYVENNYEMYYTGSVFQSKQSGSAGTQHMLSIYKYDASTRRWTVMSKDWAYTWGATTIKVAHNKCPVDLYNQDNTIAWHAYVEPTTE